MEIAPGTLHAVDISYGNNCFWENAETKASILIVNAHSLRNKLDALEAEIKFYGYPSLVVVGETWLTTGLAPFYDMNGYDSYHTTRTDGYGGLSVYVKDSVSHTTTLDLSTIEKVHMTKVHLSGHGINVLCTYRSPSSNPGAFCDMVDTFLERNSNVIMCGDTNFDLLSTREHVRKYVETIETNSYTFLNSTDPTHFTYPNGRSILDHFVTDMIDEIYHMKRNESIADHHACFLLIRGTPTPASRSNTRFAHNPRIVQALKRYLNGLNNETLDEIHLRMKHIVESNTIEKSLSRKVRFQWIDDQILTEIKRRKQLYDEAREPNLGESERIHRENRYRAQKNKVTALIRHKRNAFIDEQIQTSMNNSKKMWQVMKLTVRKNTSHQNDGTPKIIEKEDGTQLSDPQLILNELNEHFVSIGGKINENMRINFNNRPRNYHCPITNESSLYLYDTNATELRNIISKLKDDAASGTDRITVRNLKKTSQELSRALVKPINQCLRQGLFPDTFKEARVRALYKGAGSKKKCTNYRPISVLSNVAKIFEKLLYQRFYRYFTDTGAIANNQFGFLPQSSTTTAALHAISKIQQSMDDRKITAAVFIDVAKAFDSVDHAHLLKKLEHAGIRGNAHTIMQDYLFARKQKVMSNELSSSEQRMRFGIPQGSSLSSLLFLTYVNDCLSLPLQGHIQMYADDTILIYSCENLNQLHQNMEHDLNIINSWMYDNYLSFNAQKTNYMIFRLPQQQQMEIPPVTVNNTTIGRTNSSKYLGLTIDSELKWTPHIQSIKNQLYPYLFVLRKTRYSLPNSTKRSLYFAYFHSRLNYMISIWGYASATNVNQLQVIQNKAIRSLFWQEYREGTLNTEGLMRKYRIPNVRQLQRIDALTMIFKIKHNIIRNEMHLRTFEDTHQYNTRNKGNFVIPRSRLHLLHNSLFASGLSQFNQLPREIRLINDLASFRRSLKTIAIR